MNSLLKLTEIIFYFEEVFEKIYLVRSLSGDFVDRPFGNSTGKFENFWSDFTANKIQSANLDGSGLTDLVTGLPIPKGDLAIDEQNQKVYWIDAGAGNLQRADLDGSNVETIVTGIGSGGRGLDLDIPNGHIYWGDYSQM